MKYFNNIFELINFIRRNSVPLIPNTFINSSSFCLLSDQNNCLNLSPAGQMLFYFRGEYGNHPTCKSKIYRNPNNDNYIFDRLHQIEFELLLKYSPIINGNGDFSFEVIGQNLIYQVDFLALCQHYGIATEYLDLSNDLYIALYFATHSGNPMSPKYEGVGTLYCFMDDNCENIKTIGMQLFPRPGEQKAFAIKLCADDDFSKMSQVQKYVFQQTKEGSNFINNLFNGGAMLFPKDVIENKVVEIKSKTQFSLKALNEVHSRYFNDTSLSKLEKKYNDNGISFISDIPAFSESEISELVQYLSIFIDKLNHAHIRRVLYPKNPV